MEDDAIYQVDARGPGGSEYCTVRAGRTSVNAAIFTWVAPNGYQLVPLVLMRCPLCDYPIATRPDISAQCCVTRGLLTLRQVVRCPGHWPKTDVAGNIVTDVNTGRPRRVACVWAVLIIDGQAHNLRCAAVRRAGAGPCDCADFQPERFTE